MEFYKIIKNKTVVISFITIIIVNLLLCVCLENQDTKNICGNTIFKVKSTSSQMNCENKSDKQLENMSNKFCNIILLNEYNKEKVEDFESYKTMISDEQDIRNSDPQTAKWFDDNKDNLNVNDIRCNLHIVTNEIEKRSYIADYKDDLQENIDTAKNSSNISIFSNNFSTKSLKMQIDDYENLQKYNIAKTNSTAFEKTVSSQFTLFLLIAFIFATCTSLYFDKNKNLDLIVNSTQKGRIPLLCKKIFSMFVLSAFSVLILDFENYLIYALFYGYNFNLNSCIQSSQLFKDFIYNISFFQFYLLSAIFKILLLLSIALIIMALSKVTYKLNSFAIIIGIFLALELILYKTISIYSPVCILRLINVFSLFNINDWIKYSNANLFSNPVHTATILSISIIIIDLILMFINVFLVKNIKTIVSKNKIQIKINSLFVKFNNHFSKLKTKCFANYGEFYKLFFSQKFGILLIIIVGVFVTSFSYGNFEKQPVENYMDNFYSQYGGELTTKTVNSINKLQSEIDKNADEEDKIATKYANNEISFEEYCKQIAKYNSNDTQSTCLNIINDKIDYIHNMQKNGINAYLIDESGFNGLIGNDSIKSNNAYSLELLFIILFICFGLFAMDKGKTISCLIKSTANGRQQLLKSKIKLASITFTSIYLIGLIYKLIYTNHYFNLKNILSPIASLQDFSNIKFNITIAGFIALFYLITYILMLSILNFMIIINIKFKNTTSLILCFLIFICPSLLGFLEIDVIDKLSVVKFLSFVEHIQNSSNYIYFYIAITLIMFVVSLITLNKIIKSKRKKVN